MSVRKKYTRDEVTAVMRELESAIRARTDTYDTPVKFLREHPWTKKFVCVGYSEAEQLLHQSRKSDFSIHLLSISESELAWRKANARPVPIRFGTTDAGRNFVFAFDEVEGGLYTPVHGSF